MINRSKKAQQKPLAKKKKEKLTGQRAVLAQLTEHLARDSGFKLRKKAKQKPRAKKKKEKLTGQRAVMAELKERRAKTKKRKAPKPKQRKPPPLWSKAMQTQGPVYA